jgi:hypothetical protein
MLCPPPVRVLCPQLVRSWDGTLPCERATTPIRLVHGRVGKRVMRAHRGGRNMLCPPPSPVSPTGALLYPCCAPSIPAFPPLFPSLSLLCPPRDMSLESHPGPWDRTLPCERATTPIRLVHGRVGKRVIRATRGGRTMLCPPPVRVLCPPLCPLDRALPCESATKPNPSGPREGRKASNASAPGRAKHAVSPAVPGVPDRCPAISLLCPLHPGFSPAISLAIPAVSPPRHVPGISPKSPDGTLPCERATTPIRLVHGRVGKRVMRAHRGGRNMLCPRRPRCPRQVPCYILAVPPPSRLFPRYFPRHPCCVPPATCPWNLTQAPGIAPSRAKEQPHQSGWPTGGSGSE